MFDVLEVQKAFEAAKIPAVLVIIVWLLTTVIVRLFPLTGFLLIVQMLAIFALFVLTGYRATHEFGRGIPTAALAGAFGALISAVVITVADIILGFAGLGFVSASAPGHGYTARDLKILSFAGPVVAAIVNVPIGVAVNAVVAAIGGFIGKRR